MANFPWDVAITAASTLVAGALGAILAQRSDRRRSIIDAQLEGAASFLAEAQVTYSRLSRLSRRIDTEAPDWPRKNAALDRLTFVAGERLLKATIAVDAELWRLKLAVDHLPQLNYEQWILVAEPWASACRIMAIECRRCAGQRGQMQIANGRPGTGSALRTQSYWQELAEALGLDLPPNLPVAAGDTA